MKRILLLLIALLSINALQAQWRELHTGKARDEVQPYFVKEGMEWNVMNKAVAQPPFNYNTTTFATIGDTTINGTEYTKLYSKESSDVTPTGQLCSTSMIYCGAMREDNNGKVFYIPENGQECLIYDFGMEEGDTATMYWMQTVSDASRVRIRVDSITTMELGGLSRKCMYISSTSLGQNGEELNWMAYNQWVEGIGDILHGPIYSCQATNVGGIVTQTLLCCQNDEEFLFVNDEYETCVLDNITIVEGQDEIENSSSHKSCFFDASKSLLCLLDNDISFISIINTTGTCMMRFSPVSNAIDLSNLPSGIYVAIVNKKEKNNELIKFVKIK